MNYYDILAELKTCPQQERGQKIMALMGRIQDEPSVKMLSAVDKSTIDRLRAEINTMSADPYKNKNSIAANVQAIRRLQGKA